MPIVLCASQSLNVSNIHVEWKNRGSQTDFTMKSSLGNGVSTSMGWMGIGFEQQTVSLKNIKIKSEKF